MQEDADLFTLSPLTLSGIYRGEKAVAADEKRTPGVFTGG
jgi:hypothetical protein